MLRTRSPAARTTLLLALLCVSPAWGLYKVVGPDGRITYTDREPPLALGRVSEMSSTGRESTGVQLPIELREATTRYPVTLFTAPACAPCDDARQLLRQRGVPHVEKSALNNDDRDAWLRVVGGPQAPALRIGSQMLRGLTASEWTSYLDAAGYPRTSRLPPNYSYPAAEPLVPRATREARAPAPQQAASAVAEPAPSDSGGIRF